MGEDCAGMFGYEKGVRFYVPVNGTPVHVARVDFGGLHHGGRARLDLSGRGCSLVRDWTALAAELELLQELKLTRVDLAVDCLAGEFSVEDALTWWQGGDFITGGRNPRHSMLGDWGSEIPQYGRTLEVGRRGNGKMLRCYEKGRQLGEPSSPWTRFEVEIRNTDRDIPLDILTRCDEYFVGAYTCLERLLDAAAERIATHQKEGEISLETAKGHARTQYGQLLDVLRAVLPVDQLLDELARPGIPRRLEKSALAGLFKGPSPGLPQ